MRQDSPSQKDVEFNVPDALFHGEFILKIHFSNFIIDDNSSKTMIILNL